jgi:hypothetical protein
MLLILIAIWVFATISYFKIGHILISLFLAMCGLYELSGPLLYAYREAFADYFIHAQIIFSTPASDDAVNSFVLGLFLFFVILNLSYVLVSRRFYYDAADKRPEIPIETNGDVFRVFISAVFVFGVISVYTKAGSIRFLDYFGEDLEASPYFSYGTAMLVTVVIIAIFNAIHHKWRSLFFCIGAIAPLAYEIFLSSKRQSYAPSLLFMLLLILYSRRLRNRGLFAVAFTTVAMSFLGAQYWLRSESVDGYTADGFFDGVIAPQLGEFVAIGSTTFYAWMGYVLGNDPVTWGGHWLFHMSNALPFLKFGGLFFADYAGNLLDAYRTVAPWGGLSIVADAILGFGLGGIAVLAILLGALFRYWHYLLDRYLSDGMVMSVNAIYTCSMIPTLLLKYRSGLGDAAQYYVYMTILYFGAVWLGSFFPQTYESIRGVAGRCGSSGRLSLPIDGKASGRG